MRMLEPAVQSLDSRAHFTITLHWGGLSLPATTCTTRRGASDHLLGPPVTASPLLAFRSPARTFVIIGLCQVRDGIGRVRTTAFPDAVSRSTADCRLPGPGAGAERHSRARALEPRATESRAGSRAGLG